MSELAAENRELQNALETLRAQNAVLYAAMVKISQMKFWHTNDKRIGVVDDVIDSAVEALKECDKMGAVQK